MKALRFRVFVFLTLAGGDSLLKNEETNIEDNCSNSMKKNMPNESHTEGSAKDEEMHFFSEWSEKM